MTRGDRHRLLDMQEATDDVLAIVERGRPAWDDDKFTRLAAQKLLEILGEAAKQVSDDVRSRFPDVMWRDLARVREPPTQMRSTTAASPTGSALFSPTPSAPGLLHVNTGSEGILSASGCCHTASDSWAVADAETGLTGGVTGDGDRYGSYQGGSLSGSRYTAVTATATVGTVGAVDVPVLEVSSLWLSRWPWSCVSGG